MWNGWCSPTERNLSESINTCAIDLIYDCSDIIVYVQQVVCCCFAGMATYKGERCPEKVHSPYLFFSHKHPAKNDILMTHDQILSDVYVCYFISSLQNDW